MPAKTKRRGESRAIDVTVKAKHLDHDPYRLRVELVSGELEGEKFDLSVCGSNAALYFRMGGHQVVLPVKEIIEGCLKATGKLSA